MIYKKITDATLRQKYSIVLIRALMHTQTYLRETILEADSIFNPIKEKKTGKQWMAMSI